MLRMSNDWNCGNKHPRNLKRYQERRAHVTPIWATARQCLAPMHDETMDWLTDSWKWFVSLDPVIKAVGSVFGAAMTVWGLFSRVQHWRTQRRHRSTKARILSEFEYRQTQCFGSFAPQFENIVSYFPDINPDALRGVLHELVSEGALVYRSGWYYIRGREPQF
jgi:hypothetical protein